MLRHILTTVALIILPYLVYAFVDALRQRRRGDAILVDGGFWSRAPVFALGLVGCLLAVAVLVAVAVFDTNPDQPPYQPPVESRTQ